MSPDPFRLLDRLDPPDQWDEIARRVAAADDDLDLDLAPGPGLRPRRRTAALAAAAALIALVAGTVVATSGDGDGGVTTDRTAPVPTVGGPCPFTLDREAVPPALTPGSGDPVTPTYLRRMSSVQAPPRSPGSWGTLDYGGIPVTVAVFADAATAPEPLPGEQTVELVPDVDAVDVIGWSQVDGSDTCRTVEVRARLPLTPEDRERRAAEGDGAVDVGADAYATPITSRILGAVRLSPAAEGTAATTTVPADELTVGGDCPFRLEPAAGLGPLREADRPTQQFQRTDRPASWGVVAIDGVDVFVGVGEPDPQLTGRPGQRTMQTGSGGLTEVVREGSGYLRRPDEPCSFVTAIAHVPVPDGGISENDPTGEHRADARAGWRIDLVLDAVVGGDDAVLDCAFRGTGEPTPASGARCGPLPDPGTTEPPSFPDLHDPLLDQFPTPAERPVEVYFEAEAWDGFPIYVTRDDATGIVCVRATTITEACTGGPQSVGRAVSLAPDPETGEDAGAVLLGRYPDDATSTEVVGADGEPLADAEVTVAPDGEWFVAWVPHPYVDLRLDGDGPVVHR